MRNIKTVITLIVICVLILFIIKILDYTATNMENSYNKEVVTENAKISSGEKLLSEGKITNYSLKGHSYGQEVVIEKKLSKLTINNPVLMFNNNINAGVRVYIEDKMVYEKGMDAEKNSVVCNDNMIIPLLEDCSNKTIKVVLRCTNSGVFNYVPCMLYMNSKDASSYGLISNLTTKIGGITLICIGIICIALFIFNIGVNVTVKQIIYISMFSLFAGVWILSCCQVLNQFVDSYIVDFYAEYGSIYLLCLFVNLYVEDITNNKRYEKILKVLQLIWCVYTVLVFTLQVYNVVYMNDSIIGLHIITIPTFYFMLKYYIDKMKDENKSYAFVYGSLLIIVVLCTVYCVMHWIKSPVSILHVVPILFYFYVMIGIINCFIELKKAYASQAEKDALIDLIYIDKLTGICNRRGLDRFDSTIRKSGIHYDYTVYSIDLNKLKYVNDTFGHYAGDKLIKAFANQVKKVVNSNGFCGRMGGDEFVVVIREEDYDSDFENRLAAEVALYNTRSRDKFQLEYSIGSSSYKIGGTATIDDVIRLADYNMYDMKTRYHRKSKFNAF